MHLSKARSAHTQITPLNSIPQYSRSYLPLAHFLRHLAPVLTSRTQLRKNVCQTPPFLHTCHLSNTNSRTPSTISSVTAFICHRTGKTASGKKNLCERWAIPASMQSQTPPAATRINCYTDEYQTVHAQMGAYLSTFPDGSNSWLRQ